VVIIEKQRVAVDYKRCHPESCEEGMCLIVRECPRRLFKQEEPYDPPFVISGFCEDCGRCIEMCPLQAVYPLVQ
jgi:Fe-S-cluster-containing hydrogenase component 2